MRLIFPRCCPFRLLHGGHCNPPRPCDRAFGGEGASPPHGLAQRGSGGAKTPFSGARPPRAPGPAPLQQGKEVKGSLSPAGRGWRALRRGTGGEARGSGLGGAGPIKLFHGEVHGALDGCCLEQKQEKPPNLAGQYHVVTQKAKGCPSCPPPPSMENAVPTHHLLLSPKLPEAKDTHRSNHCSKKARG